MTSCVKRGVVPVHVKKRAVGCVRACFIVGLVSPYAPSSPAHLPSHRKLPDIHLWAPLLRVLDLSRNGFLSVPSQVWELQSLEVLCSHKAFHRLHAGPLVNR